MLWAMQAVNEEEFAKFKQQLHGAYAPSTLRFAENAEQQHTDVHDNEGVPDTTRLVASSSQALAGRLAPHNGFPGTLNRHQVRPTH